MTSKEFVKIREFYGTHYNLQMRGYIWIAPQAVKKISRASPVAQSWARRNYDIYIKPKKMRIDGNYVKIMCEFNGVFLVDRKYIKSILLFHYNY